MATRTPKGKGISSNTKLSAAQKNGHAANDSHQQQQQEYVLLDKDLVRGLSEKEVEIEHLKTTIVALNEKVEIINDLKKDVETHKELFHHSEEKRHELQIHITETSVKIQQDSAEHSSYQTELIDENEQLKNEIQQLKQQQAKRDQDQQLKLEQLNQDNKAKVDKISDEHHSKIKNLINEHHEKLEKVTQECHQKISQMSQEHQAKQEAAAREYHNKLEATNNENKEKIDEMRNEMETLRREKDQQIRHLENEIEAQREINEKKINELELTIKRQQQNILQSNSTIIELKEIITQKSDVEDQLHHAREQITKLDSQKTQLQKELETASDYILELEDKVYKANKTSLELLKQLKDAEVEIETLKNYIIELKQRIAVYIPVKDDAIDKRLAEFINNYPERQKLKIMFMRESEGVYQFGTKRIAVRVDKDKINIRVGGGYLSIDEFLDQYTPVELEKLERKDPLKKFSEKVAIQKTIVGKEIRESSPLRSPTRASPDKSPTRKNV